MTRHSYTVHILSTPLSELSEERLLALVEALETERRIVAPVTSANSVTGTVGATVSVDASRPQDALDLALESFLKAARKAEIPDVEIAEATVEATTEDEHDRHELVSGAEVARRIGLSRERVRQIVDRLPTPVARVGSTRVWRWGDIADWRAAKDRPRAAVVSAVRVARSTTTGSRAARSAAKRSKR